MLPLDAAWHVLSLSDVKQMLICVVTQTVGVCCLIGLVSVLYFFVSGYMCWIKLTTLSF